MKSEVCEALIFSGGLGFALLFRLGCQTPLFATWPLATRMRATEPTATAANAINTLGIDLLHSSGKPDANVFLSPYSIQSALAMTYAGAEGESRAEMAKVLHYPKDDAETHGSFAALRKSLDEVVQKSAKDAEQMTKRGVTNAPITLTVANRLFGQSGYDFREPFLALVKDNSSFSTRPPELGAPSDQTAVRVCSETLPPGNSGLYSHEALATYLPTRAFFALR